MYYPGEIENNSYAIFMGLEGAKEDVLCALWKLAPDRNQIPAISIMFSQKKGGKEKGS